MNDWNIPEPGLDPPEQPPMWRCPECGEELNFDDKVYRDHGGCVIGCQHCIDMNDAEDVAHLLEREGDC